MKEDISIKRTIAGKWSIEFDNENLSSEAIPKLESEIKKFLWECNKIPKSTKWIVRYTGPEMVIVEAENPQEAVAKVTGNFYFDVYQHIDINHPYKIEIHNLVMNCGEGK